jgi:hypothetical protein
VGLVTVEILRASVPSIIVHSYEQVPHTAGRVRVSTENESRFDD